MLPVKKIENLVKKETKHVSSVTHDFGHLKRTAAGAEWFAKILGADQKEAYVAGLLHDIVRPPSQKVDHAKASAARSEQILRQFVSPQVNREICSAIATHREIALCFTPLQKALIFSDKILEQMGAFIVLRRCMFVGECLEYKGKDFRESIISQFEGRLVMYNPGEFPKTFAKLVNYQYQWPKEFWLAFKNNEKWAVELARGCYEAGVRKEDLEKTILNLPTISKGKKFKDEAVSYIKGEKFSQFRKMIK